MKLGKVFDEVSKDMIVSGFSLAVATARQRCRESTGDMSALIATTIELNKLIR